MSLKKIYDRLSSETQSEFREAMREEIKASEEEILYAKKNLDGWLEDIEVMQFQVEGWLKHYFSLLEEHRKLITFVKETGLLEEYAVPMFLKFYVSNNLATEVAPNSVGSVIQFIKLGDLQNFHIAIPDMEEQEKIATYLEEKCAEIDSVVTKTKATIEEYKKLKQSIITNGYIASQIVLNNPMLFSTSGLAKYLLPGASGTKNAVDKHHIFPKNYLTQIGYTTDRDRNQAANFTYLDYVTNIDISDDAPALYIERYKEKLGEEYKTHCDNHALPENFETMDYMEFLSKRRILMAQIIKKAFFRNTETF